MFTLESSYLFQMNLKFDGLSKNVSQILIFMCGLIWDSKFSDDVKKFSALRKSFLFWNKKERVFGFLRISISFQVIIKSA